MQQLKTYPTIGVCGLDCGLCPRYYTAGPSRCPGCGGPDFLNKHPSCSFITCCVKKQGLEVCGQCPEFPCPKFKSEEAYQQAEISSSYPPCRNMLSNLFFIKEKGIKKFAERQEKRIALLEMMIENYDEGRSKSFFCRATALLRPSIVERSVKKAQKAITSNDSAIEDAAAKAGILRSILTRAALAEGIDLKGRK